MSRKAAAAAGDLVRGEAAILEFTKSNLTPERLRQRAAHFLMNPRSTRSIQGLSPEEKTKFLDRVDQAYPTIDSHNTKFITALGKLCGASGLLPTSAVLSAGLEKRGTIAVASGGFTDIWRGEYNGAQVAIKALHIYPALNLKEAKEILWKRVPVWRRLSHEHVLPFRGVDMTVFQIALVYDWGQNGNISQFIASHPRASRVSLLFGVAKGLQYLHSLDIPHGGLKGANVVIDRRGHPRLTNYGLVPINPPRKGTRLPVMESKTADVFAFGMFAVEVFTGKVSFDEQKNEAAVLRISQGGRPEVPGNAQAVGLTGEMWELLESCWQQDPKKRPTMEEIVERWGKFVENNDNDGVLLEELQPPAGPTQGSGRHRVETEALQPPTRPGAARLRPGSAAIQPRTEAHRLKTISEAVRPRTKFEAVQQGVKSEVVQQVTRTEIVQPRTHVQFLDPPPTPTRRKCFCGLF